MPDEPDVLSKLELAERQLEGALRLFLNDRDYVCAITLAGASEEILGKLLEREGRKHSLDELLEMFVSASRNFGVEVDAKAFRKLANYFRDGLKHIADGAPMVISREPAENILIRAVDNYWALTGKESALMRQFIGEIYGSQSA